jgi:hypothetical protein
MVSDGNSFVKTNPLEARDCEFRRAGVPIRRPCRHSSLRGCHQLSKLSNQVSATRPCQLTVTRHPRRRRYNRREPLAWRPPAGVGLGRAFLLCMGLFSRFLVATLWWAPPLPRLRAATVAASLDPGAAAPFPYPKIPFGNLALTMISVWLGA